MKVPEDPAHFAYVVETIRARYVSLDDFAVKGLPYFADVFLTEAASEARMNEPGARELLRELGARLAATPEFTEASVEAELRKLATEKGVKAGVLINGSRAVLTGQAVGPSAFHLFTAIGRERSIQRLKGV